MKGCSNECATKVHHLNETDIFVAHQRFSHLGNFQQRQWVLDYLHTNTCKETNGTIFVISGKAVCLSVWLSVLGLKKSRYYDVCKEFLRGVLFFEHLSGTTMHRPKFYKAIAWMQHCFNQVGDQMPDQLAIYLPSFLTHGLLYGRMKEELEQSWEKWLVSHISTTCSHPNSHMCQSQRYISI